jgi:hypothetical protein
MIRQARTLVVPRQWESPHATPSSCSKFLSAGRRLAGWMRAVWRKPRVIQRISNESVKDGRSATGSLPPLLSLPSPLVRALRT